MAEIEVDGKVRWYLELTCPEGHEVRPSGRVIRHRSGTVSFLAMNLERACPLCELATDRARVAEGVRVQAAMKADGWKEAGTGGGCTALVKTLGARAYYLLTSIHGPDTPKVGEGAVVGYYDEDDGEPKWTTEVRVFNGPASVSAAIEELEAAQVDRAARRQEA